MRQNSVEERYLEHYPEQTWHVRLASLRPYALGRFLVFLDLPRVYIRLWEYGNHYTFLHCIVKCTNDFLLGCSNNALESTSYHKTIWMKSNSVTILPTIKSIF